MCFRPYRKPTQVGREKHPKVIERPSVKELGKMTPNLRKKGCLSSFPPSEEGEQRSEEHTSELQSHLNLVCRLLLEKKKQQNMRVSRFKLLFDIPLLSYFYHNYCLTRQPGHTVLIRRTAHV